MDSHGSISIDIETKVEGGRATFKALTERGYKWIIDEITHSANGIVTVDAEYQEELIVAMKKEGLNVSS